MESDSESKLDPDSLPTLLSLGPSSTSLMTALPSESDGALIPNPSPESIPDLPSQLAGEMDCLEI